jgi:glycosyltransferase involved in cell wall biosynthesis
MSMPRDEEIALSILMPCLNEARTIGTCIAKAKSYFARTNIAGEIVVADNGSIDRSVAIAESLGARVVSVEQRGYGHALAAGIRAARGTFVIMGDADDSYDFAALDGFVEMLRAGCDLVLGNRFAGGIDVNAMPPLHRYFGNPLLTALGRVLFKTPAKDLYCGLRGFRRAPVLELGLAAPGMEFALEMIVKATIARLRIAEVPTVLHADGRGRPPHLRSWRDGWRSLRFYLLLSPEGLFLYPGGALALLSGLTSLILFFANIRIGGVVFAQHTLILTCALAAVGIQSVFFWMLAKSLAIKKRLVPPDRTYEVLRPWFALERCLAGGGLLVAGGLGASGYSLFHWYSLRFGPLEGDTLIRLVCAASFLISVGCQLIFAAFFMLLLDQQPGPETAEETAQQTPRAVATPPGRALGVEP